MNIAPARQFKKAFGGSEPLTAIISPPPTPNGDLHLGHLAGPYLSADVLQRYQRLRGRKCVSAISVDLNQSYVVTTAERLTLEPTELAQCQFHNIHATLAAAEICFDVVGMPDANYTAYIQDWFRRLYAGGELEKVETTVPYDASRDQFLFEAYASGWCPTCLAAAKGNICEACGHPNEPARLFNLHATGGRRSESLEMRRQSGLVLNLECWRDQLTRHLLGALPELRPNLRRLIEELLSGTLPAFPITFPSTWGIPAPFPNCRDLVLNVWAEMVPGHYYWLERAHAAKGGVSPLIGGGTPVDYVQCLGFDNSFFYACAHLALAFAAQELGIEALIPRAIVTNEFYQLDSFKFSTSQGHAIWGRDFLQEVPVDEARFYFAWSNPETQQSNFLARTSKLSSTKSSARPYCTSSIAYTACHGRYRRTSRIRWQLPSSIALQLSTSLTIRACASLHRRWRAVSLWRSTAQKTIHVPKDLACSLPPSRRALRLSFRVPRLRWRTRLAMIVQ
jgi:methionyl-tRNA synthetase